MIEIESQCVGCRSIGLHCLGHSCPNREVEVRHCDRCGCEIGDMTDYYLVDDEELCEECLKEEFKVTEEH